MKNIELFWNIVFYGIYKFDIFLRYLVGFLNPFKLINKIKGVREYHSKYGVNDMDAFRNRIFNNRLTGISIIWSSATIGGLLILIEYGIFNFIQGVTKKALIEKVWQDSSHFFTYLIILLIPALLINHSLLYKKNKYLQYFEEFDKMLKSKRRKYYFISFISICFIILFFFLSFLWL